MLAPNKRYQLQKGKVTNRVPTLMKARRIRLIGFIVTSVSKRKIRIDSIKENRLKRKMKAPKKTGECLRTPNQIK